jgi:hypothetical protein
MSNETKSHLIAVLLTHGQVKLAECVDVSASEISKKINGDNGWTLEQLAKAFDFVGAQVIPGDETIAVVKRDELIALRTLARKSLQGDGE